MTNRFCETHTSARSQIAIFGKYASLGLEVAGLAIKIAVEIAFRIAFRIEFRIEFRIAFA